MESISMDLKVMPNSFHGYNYLLVMHCNHSHFNITDTLKGKQPKWQGQFFKSWSVQMVQTLKRFIVIMTQLLEMKS